MKPKISIIVPVYKVEKYLNRCMESLLRQSLKEIEIILVDDGSPDRCPELCDKYSNENSNVKVIHKKNCGLGFARNSGLEIATGEYVAFVDSDDYVAVDMYEILYREASSSNSDAVFSNFKTEVSPEQWIESQEVDKRTEWNDDEIKEFILDMVANEPTNSRERSYQMSVWHSIYRRSIIQEANIRFHSEREILSEDFPFQIDFLLNAHRIVFLPNVFYHYCNNESSLAHSWDSNKIVRCKKLYDLMSRQLLDIENAQVRLDRFYIGYLRAQLLSMYDSGIPHKKQWIKLACEELILTGIPDRYPKHTMSRAKRVLFTLTYKKYVTLISIFLFLHKVSGLKHRFKN